MSVTTVNYTKEMWLFGIKGYINCKKSDNSIFQGTFSGEDFFSYKKINVIRCLKNFENIDFLFAKSMNYFKKRNLFDYVFLDRSCKRLKEIFSIQLQILEGLSFLHKRNICHRNIRAENILYSLEGQLPSIKITNFSFAINLKKEIKNFSIKELTPKYTSFEILFMDSKKELKQLLLENDIWATALVFYLLETGKFFNYQKNAENFGDQGTSEQVKEEIKVAIKLCLKNGWRDKFLKNTSRVTKNMLNFSCSECQLSSLISEIRRNLLMNIESPLFVSKNSLFKTQ